MQVTPAWRACAAARRRPLQQWRRRACFASPPLQLAAQGAAKKGIGGKQYALACRLAPRSLTRETEAESASEASVSAHVSNFRVPPLPDTLPPHAQAVGRRRAPGLGLSGTIENEAVLGG